MNPAEHCTRYTPFSQLMSQTSWIDVPKCLKCNSSFTSSESLTIDGENLSTVIGECQVHIATNNTEKTAMGKNVSETYLFNHEVKRKMD